MKYILPFILVQCATITLYGQELDEENFRRQLVGIDDTAKVNLLSDFSNWGSNPEITYTRAQEGLKLSQSIGYKRGETKSLISLSLTSWALGDYVTAIKLGYSVLDNISHQDTLLLYTYAAITNSYRDQGDYREALIILNEVLKIIKSSL